MKRVKMGRPPRAGKAAEIKLTIRVTATERDAWAQLAGSRPLGVWIRERCNGHPMGALVRGKGGAR